MLEYLTFNLNLRTSTNYPYRVRKGELVCDCSNCRWRVTKPRLLDVIALGHCKTPWTALLRNGLQYTALCTPTLLPREKYLPVSAFFELADVPERFRTGHVS